MHPELKLIVHAMEQAIGPLSFSLLAFSVLLSFSLLSFSCPVTTKVPATPPGELGGVPWTGGA